MAHHQKATDGSAKLARGLAAHLPAPRDFDDWHYLTQLNQARALAFGIEHFRSLRPLCMGTIMWQLNDCWPVTSWSAVDGDGRKKPLWYALRDAYADRLLTLQPRTGAPITAGGPPADRPAGPIVTAEGVPALIAVNDGGASWPVDATVTRRDLSGRILASASLTATAGTGTAVTLDLPSDVVTAGDPATELILAEAGGHRAWWFFAPDKDVAWPPADYSAAVATDGGSTRVTVTAHSILRSLTVFPDRLHPTAEADAAGVTLLPGDSFTFEIRCAEPLDASALTSRPVLRCVNDIGRAR
jgi:beta-mannosidase